MLPSATAQTLKPMRIEAKWYSQKGTKTPDNRDHAGIGTNTSGVMGIVVDGSTAGENSGEYAEAIVREVIEWFPIYKERLMLMTFRNSCAQSISICARVTLGAQPVLLLCTLA